MNQSTWINTQAKKAAFSMATLAAGALAALSFVSQASAYPGAPAPFDQMLSLKAACRLPAPDGQVRTGFVENIELTPQLTCEKQKPRLVLVSQWARLKSGENLKDILAKKPARYTLTDYDGSSGWYLTYRAEILDADGSKMVIPLSEMEFDRNMRIMPLMSEHSPLQAKITYVSNKIGAFELTPNPETQKTLPIVATCTTTKGAIHTYTSRISDSIEHLANQEKCPDGSQMVLSKIEETAGSQGWEYRRQSENYYRDRLFFNTKYAISVSSKFGVVLANISVNGSTWDAYALDLKTASEKHPVLLQYDVEKNVIIDVKAQANPRQF